MKRGSAPTGAGVPSSPEPSTASGLTAELLRRVQHLELVAGKNVAGLRPGDYETAVRGQGLLFHETRKYVPGESARHIDWNITARLADPHVRVHLEERQREVMVVLDVSPSMHVGWARRTKLELGIELAATLAAATARSGDQLGHLIYADRVLAESRPRGGRTQLFRVLRSLLEHAGPWQRRVAETDVRVAIHALESSRSGPRRSSPGTGRVIFLISDFIDQDLPDDLRYLRARHDVSLLHVYDPFEYNSGPVLFSATPPEGRNRVAHLRSSETGSLQDMQAYLRTRSAEARIAFESFSTTAPVTGPLHALFHRKRRRGKAL